MKTVQGPWLFVGALAFASAGMASASTYTIQNTSFVDVSGSDTLSLIFSGPGGSLGASDSAVLSPQAPGSLHTSLSGHINAEASGGVLNILAGSLVAANDNGNWSPYGTPANAGAMEHLTLSFMTGDVIVVDALYALRNGTATLGGSASLTGSPALRSFMTSAIGMPFIGGILDAQVTVSGDGVSETVFDSVPLDSVPWIGMPMTGTLSNDGVLETLTLPFSLTAVISNSESRPVDGFPEVTMTLSGTTTATLSGQIVAVRPVPEPSTWMTMLLGVGLVGCAGRFGKKARG